MYDIHLHILPDIDDGPQTVAESIAIVNYLSKIGYTHITATPHYKRGLSLEPSAITTDKIERFKMYLKVFDIKLHKGNEVYLTNAFEAPGKINDFILLGANEDYVLLEAPTRSFPIFTLEAVIFELFKKQIKVILAHPERIIEPEANMMFLEKLHDMGVKFQINLPSLGNYYGKNAYKKATLLLEKNMVFCIGTDTHSLKMAKKYIPLGFKNLNNIIGSSKIRSLSNIALKEMGY